MNPLPALSSAALLVLLTACFHVSAPLKSTVTGPKIEPADLAWIRPSETTRREILDNWGPPTLELRHERLLGYAWTVDGGASWEFAVPGANAPSNSGHWGNTDRFAAWFAFDSQDRVTRCQIVSVNDSPSLEQAGKDWLVRPASP